MKDFGKALLLTGGMLGATLIFLGGMLLVSYAAYIGD